MLGVVMLPQVIRFKALATQIKVWTKQAFMTVADDGGGVASVTFNSIMTNNFRKLYTVKSMSLTVLDSVVCRKE